MGENMSVNMNVNMSVNMRVHMCKHVCIFAYLEKLRAEITNWPERTNALTNGHEQFLELPRN